MDKIFFAFMGCAGIPATMWLLTSDQYVLAIVAAICTGVEFWGAFREEDNDG